MDGERVDGVLLVDVVVVLVGEKGGEVGCG